MTEEGPVSPARMENWSPEVTQCGPGLQKSGLWGSVLFPLLFPLRLNSQKVPVQGTGKIVFLGQADGEEEVGGGAQTAPPPSEGWALGVHAAPFLSLLSTASSSLSLLFPEVF